MRIGQIGAATGSKRVISLFSGAGGLDLGLIQAGHRIVWANDSDADAVSTYRANIGNHILLQDVANVDWSDVPAAEVLVGGFPCQGFSHANLHRFEEDERNQLYLEFRRAIIARRPSYFLAENVRGILSLAGGRVIERILGDLSDCGYRVTPQLFDMADYGVPQRRWRVIIAGTREDLPETEDFPFPKRTHCNPRKANDAGLKPWKTVSEALSGIPEPDQRHYLKNHTCSKYKVTNRNFTGHRTTDPQKPSPTILARGNARGGVCAIQHPRNHRRMSIREQAILQTFPNSFEFLGKMNSCYRQVGNAVPVLFGLALGQALRSVGVASIVDA